MLTLLTIAKVSEKISNFASGADKDHQYNKLFI